MFYCYFVSIVYSSLDDFYMINFTAGLAEKIMAAYRRVYDKRHLQADCQEPGSAPEPYAR